MSQIASDIRKYDYYRYLCCLLAPACVRGYLITIYAFNNEISKIKYVVTEPMAGHIRLQWWRDAIDEIYNGMPIKHNNPVVNSLYDLICETDIDKELFHKLIDAREADIDFSVPQNIEALYNYTENTSSNLFRLLCAVCEVRGDASDEAAHHAGIAYGLVDIMRNMRYNCYHNRLMFPKDLMTLASISEEEIIGGKNLKNTCNITKALCDKAINSLRHVRELEKELPKRSFNAFMPLCVVEPMVNKIRSNGYDLFDLDFERSRFSMQCSILASKLFCRV